MRTRWGLTLGLLLLLSGSAHAQVQSICANTPMATKGTANLATTDTAALLSSVTGGIPTNSIMAVGVVVTNPINYSTSGTPTQTGAPTVGIPVSVGGVITICQAQLTKFSAINQTNGSNGQINWEFFGR